MEDRTKDQTETKPTCRPTFDLCCFAGEARFRQGRVVDPAASASACARSAEALTHYFTKKDGTQKAIRFHTKDPRSKIWQVSQVVARLMKEGESKFSFMN